MLAQGVTGAHLQQGVEFGDRVAGRGVVDEGGGGVEQCAVDGEADVTEGPQAAGVEPDGFREGLEAAVVRVAGVRVELAELADGGALGAGAERGQQLGHASDSLAAQQLDEGIGGELNRSHGDATAEKARDRPEPRQYGYVQGLLMS